MQIIIVVSVLLEYIDIFNQTLPIMLALCLMLLGTYYAQNYASIIGGCLSYSTALVQIMVSVLLEYAYQT